MYDNKESIVKEVILLKIKKNSILILCKMYNQIFGNIFFMLS